MLHGVNSAKNRSPGAHDGTRETDTVRVRARRRERCPSSHKPHLPALTGSNPGGNCCTAALYMLCSSGYSADCAARKASKFLILLNRLCRIIGIMENHRSRRSEKVLRRNRLGPHPIGTRASVFRCTPHIPLPGNFRFAVHWISTWETAPRSAIW